MGLNEESGSDGPANTEIARLQFALNDARRDLAKKNERIRALSSENYQLRARLTAK